MMCYKKLFVKNRTIKQFTHFVGRPLPAFILAISFPFTANAAPGYAAAASFESIMANCNAGATSDCLAVGIAYKAGEFKGKKITKDSAKSRQFIDQAVRFGEKNCQGGDPMDCYTIGLLYFEGGGIIATDVSRGLDYLQKSCRGGYKQACAWLDASGLKM